MNPAVLLEVLLILGAAILGIVLLVKLLMGLGWAVGQAFRFVSALLQRAGRFVSATLHDALRIVGGAITSAFFVPFIVLNVVFGRWSAANHYGRALEGEVMGLAKASYRLALGNPARLLGLDSLVEGIEQRLPETVARAPGTDAPRRRPDAFDGYTVVGSLPSGGSGARLWLAEPLPQKREQLSTGGRACPPRVVIKSFSLLDGSTMPQIVRESRALESARQLGLVLEHELTGTRFHYVMPYVPGEDLSLVTRRLHDESGSEGLGERQLAAAVEYVADLLGTLHRFHSHGLWHKDIKPTNIIVSAGRVHLVDLGLTTPLRSAMTLTTHGTEYFRDPELVRLALRGVKVHEVDGVKFDIYGAGAVLYSLVENSFPAHGSLSQIRKRCPEALRWIIRRAMAEMSQRYGSALEMLADLRALQQARNPHKLAPAKLPSMQGRPAPPPPAEVELLAGLPAPPPPLGPVPGEQDAGRRARRGERGIAASSRRGSLSWGAAAAALFALALVGAGSLLFLAPAGGRPVLHRSVQHGPAPVPPRNAGAGHVRGGSAGTTWRGVPVALVKQQLPAASVAQRRPAPGRVLLLDDLGAERIADREALAELLEHARLLPVDLEHVDASDLHPERAIALIASARTQVGLSDPTDPDVRQRLQGWLDDHAPEIDAILWLGESREGDIAHEVVARDDTTRTDLLTLLSRPRPAAQTAGGEPYRIY